MENNHSSARSMKMTSIQTPAEKYMVQRLVSLLRSKDDESDALQILNAGAENENEKRIGDVCENSLSGGIVSA